MTTVRPLGAVRDRLEAFMRAARHIHEGDVDAVHKTRVASRRLRELLPLLGLDHRSASKLGSRLTKVTRRLGVVRELDVLSLMLQDLGRDSRYSAMALEHVSAVVQDDRIAARDRLAARCPLQKLERLTSRIQGAATQPEVASEQRQPRSAPRPRQAWAWAVEARAARRAASVRSAIEAAGTVYVPERLHDVRIAVKKLRYALELLAEARSRRKNRDIGVLRSAQDLLGRLHDLEVLIGRARGEQVALSAPLPPVWYELDALIGVLEDDCRSLHASYVRDRITLLAIADSICDTKKYATGRSVPSSARSSRAAGSR